MLPRVGGLVTHGVLVMRRYNAAQWFASGRQVVSGIWVTGGIRYLGGVGWLVSWLVRYKADTHFITIVLGYHHHAASCSTSYCLARAPATPTPCQRTFFLIIPYENCRAYLAISLCFYHSAAGSLSHLSNVAGRQSMPVAFHLVNLDEIDSHAPSARCGYHSRDIIMSIFIFGVVRFARQGRHRPSRVRSFSWIGASADQR